MPEEREDMIMLAIAALRGDINRQIDKQNEHAERVEAEVFRQIRQVDDKVSEVKTSGCVKAGHHEDIERRVKAIELKEALQKGELRGIVMTVSFIGTVLGAILTMIIEWIRK